MLVRGRMVRDVVVATPETAVGAAHALMGERRIRHLPVVDGGALVGVVSDRDLRSALPAPGLVPEEERRRLEERPVGEVMQREVVVVDPDTPVEEAARLMAHHRIGCLPVVSGAEVVGILTASDLVRAFVELFGVDRPSSRIEVRLANRPGELARVVRLIGVDERVNITGLVMPPSGAGEVVAVIRVQTVDPRRIVAGLRGLGYEVGWPALELAALDAASMAPARGRSPERATGPAE